ncbi:uncharacterized protein B0H18DRAFT_1043429, partial [Fomitopsis serialis]|uniref:uncharacterized protein n=1 Tax=Fomitopsis serialis TaxID=139415 RepID=UPI0020079FC0
MEEMIKESGLDAALFNEVYLSWVEVEAMHFQIYTACVRGVPPSDRVLRGLSASGGRGGPPGQRAPGAGRPYGCVSLQLAQVLGALVSRGRRARPYHEGGRRMHPGSRVLVGDARCRLWLKIRWTCLLRSSWRRTLRTRVSRARF